MKDEFEVNQRRGLEMFYELEEIPIMPFEKVILPVETVSMEVADPQLAALLINAEKKYGIIGFSYSTDGELPPVEHIGCAAALRVLKIRENLHIARFFGLRRYYAERYTAFKPFPVVEFSDYEDTDAELPEARRELERTIALYLETTLIRGDKIKDDYAWLRQNANGIAELVSFKFIKAWMNLPETRYEILKMRSARERLEMLNALIVEYNRKEAVAERKSKNN